MLYPCISAGLPNMRYSFFITVSLGDGRSVMNATCLPRESERTGNGSMPIMSIAYAIRLALGVFQNEFLRGDCRDVYVVLGAFWDGMGCGVAGLDIMSCRYAPVGGV